jgi:hypothetical protein
VTTRRRAWSYRPRPAPRLGRAREHGAWAGGRQGARREHLDAGRGHRGVGPARTPGRVERVTAGAARDVPVRGAGLLRRWPPPQALLDEDELLVASLLPRSSPRIELSPGEDPCSECEKDHDEDHLQDPLDHRPDTEHGRKNEEEEQQEHALCVPAHKREGTFMRAADEQRRPERQGPGEVPASRSRASQWRRRRARQAAAASGTTWGTVARLAPAAVRHHEQNRRCLVPCSRVR